MLLLIYFRKFRKIENFFEKDYRFLHHTVAVLAFTFLALSVMIISIDEKFVKEGGNEIET